MTDRKEEEEEEKRRREQERKDCHLSWHFRVCRSKLGE
jgi:hypothetical protein